MKKLLTILFAFLLGSQQIFAQTSQKMESFRANVLPQYSTYFIQAALTENGRLNLSAADKYIVLPSEDKKAVMAHIATAWSDSLVLVNYGSRRELWGWNAGTGNVRLLDAWDLNASQAAKINVAKPQKMIMHPWFFYIGGQMLGDNQKNINISFNSRLGFFLLLNRWDFAATYSTGMTGRSDAPEGTAWSNIGVMSRVHFPIKNTSLSPNIGAEIALASFGDAQATFKPALVLGLSWFVGIGRVDIGIKIGDVTSGTGGYSIYPGLGKVR